MQLDALSKVDAAISDASDAIQDRLRSTYDVLYGVQGLFLASEQVTREEFERYLAGLNLTERHPTIRTINFSRRVALAEKEEFVLRARGDRSLLSTDYSEFEIKPGGERADYLPIIYIWPL
ncbi:MAG: CHASE domain-containing protein, partial [Burkholderiales bacterium]